MQSILGLAVLEARSGRPRMALKMYMKGLQTDPDNIQLLHASAQLLQQQEQTEVGFWAPPLHADSGHFCNAAVVLGGLASMKHSCF